MGKNGYTFVELLVALTIVGLIFGIGYVNFRDFSRRQALAGQARSVKGDLRLAQENALAGNKPSAIACNSPNTLDSYNFDVVSSGNYRIVASCSGGTVIVKDVFLPSDVTISGSLDPIIFKILGQGTNIASGAAATITLTQAATGNTRVVTVSSGGEIK
ncbi:MAG: GspH/FimT family pseudopilin [Patescibacteria group bacterium]